MNIQKISERLCVLALLCAFPAVSHGYTTSNQTATSLTDTSALYTVTYEFGHAKSDFYMPISAVRGVLHGDDSSFSLGYTMRRNSREVTEAGSTAGLVLSSADVVDNQYFVPAGTLATFTLVVILTTEADTPETDYALQVEQLPFRADVGGTALHARSLNPSELVYYLTPEAELNGG